MSDTLPTVWDSSPHTHAKHRILEAYLKAWMPILSRARPNQQILFVDGFAGPGEYAGGEPGSPVIALRTALNHSHPFPAPINFLFIEMDPDRFRHLCGVIDNLRPQITRSTNINLLPPLQDDCSTKLESLLESYESKGIHFGPALVFLDQFGYSAVSMDLVARIMKYPSCEVFSYLEWNRMNNYLSDKTKWPGITRAFGSEAWQAALKMSGRHREDFLLNLYKEQIRTRAQAKYVWNFAMRGTGDRLLYWLFFCSSHIRGLEEMKRAMWKVDESGGFRFSDAANPGQLSFLSGINDSWLAEHLHKQFAAEKKKVSDIYTYVLTETPCYKFKKALVQLESASKLSPVNPQPKRKRGTFDDLEMSVQFAPLGSGPSKPNPPRQGVLF